jgi:aspartyl-tRNA synthetase
MGCSTTKSGHASERRRNKSRLEVIEFVHFATPIVQDTLPDGSRDMLVKK